MKAKKAAKKPSGRRFEWWKTYMNTFNYHLIAENGENLYHTNQNFNSLQGVKKNIASVAEAYGGSWKNIPMYQVKPPKITK